MNAQHTRISPERERQLVRQIQNGQRGALGELLGAYHKRIYHQCLRMLGNADDAAEIAQDTLVKAIEHVDTFSGKSRFSTWLFRIAMNLSISYMRKRKVRYTTSLDAETGGQSSDQAAPLKAMMADSAEPQPDQSVETNEQITLMLHALEQLDVNLKSVILLRDLQEMDYRDIAESLDLPIGTVKSRLFRGRLALRQAMITLNKKGQQD